MEITADGPPPPNVGCSGGLHPPSHSEVLGSRTVVEESCAEAIAFLKVSYNRSFKGTLLLDLSLPDGGIKHIVLECDGIVVREVSSSSCDQNTFVSKAASTTRVAMAHSTFKRMFNGELSTWELINQAIRGDIHVDKMRLGEVKAFSNSFDFSTNAWEHFYKTDAGAPFKHRWAKYSRSTTTAAAALTPDAVDHEVPIPLKAVGQPSPVVKKDSWWYGYSLDSIYSAAWKGGGHAAEAVSDGISSLWSFVSAVVPGGDSSIAPKDPMPGPVESKNSSAVVKATKTPRQPPHSLMTVHAGGDADTPTQSDAPLPVQRSVLFSVPPALEPALTPVPVLPIASPDQPPQPPLTRLRWLQPRTSPLPCHDPRLARLLRRPLPAPGPAIQTLRRVLPPSAVRPADSNLRWQHTNSKQRYTTLATDGMHMPRRPGDAMVAVLGCRTERLAMSLQHVADVCFDT